MTMKITGTGRRITLTANGKRCGVTIATGPWIGDLDPAMIKIRPKQFSFPREIAGAFDVENNSDSQTDYFEKDQIRLFPGHPLYEQAKAAAA
jgi:hypothetical protein